MAIGPAGLKKVMHAGKAWISLISGIVEVVKKLQKGKEPRTQQA